jgi:hypothetical protein
MSLEEEAIGMRIWLLVALCIFAACGGSESSSSRPRSSRALALCEEALPGSDAHARAYEACKSRGHLMVEVGGRYECLERASTYEECEARGGEWHQDLPDFGTCFEPTSDAGKPCCDLDDCEGFCAAPEDAEDFTPTQGACSPMTGSLCGNWVKNGLASGSFCL